MIFAEVYTFPKAEEDGLDHLNIKIDKNRDKDLSEQAYKLLKDYYCKSDEDSSQQAYARAAVAYCDGDLGLAQRIHDYVSKGWFMFASPVLSNAPRLKTKKQNITYFLFFNLCTRFLEGLIDSVRVTLVVCQRWRS